MEDSEPEPELELEQVPAEMEPEPERRSTRTEVIGQYGAKTLDETETSVSAIDNTKRSIAYSNQFDRVI